MEKTACETAEDFILRLILEKVQTQRTDAITEDLYDRKAALLKELLEVNETIARASRIDPGENEPRTN